ncbi:TonB-dependent receptor plug domain-containing protein [Croceitalea sp. MTPC9]|uniref:TonB-dependent receptor plug domain-containing protein n=1 Tax=unclassified Croceitalea TaxID=2632280 RepID=UPI002B39CE02|nr:TonB-dependent receptor plug domain-containing protein [Croceitalea sp. MTPC6]GMN15378.1 TonB-dependent receptor plug domain-containing protein [Croceitalea sp. MTPC9]
MIPLCPFNFLKTNTKFFCIFFLLTLQNSFSQKEKPAQFNAEIPIEKLYVHLNKTYFTAGEDIWFKAYLVDGKTHQLNAVSEIAYIELIDAGGKIIANKTIKLTNGNAPGNFKLNQSSQKGIYTVRAYTNYMRNFHNSNFFEKQIFVNVANNGTNITTSPSADTGVIKPDVQFFPEGGYMVNGFLNPIGFKAVDTNGMGISVSGKIIDDKGNLIKEFASSHLGLGLLHFIPKNGDSYSAIIYNQETSFTYKLPIALNEGVLMTVTDNKDYYKAEIRATNAIDINGFSVIGKQRKKIVFKTKVNTNKKKNAAIVKVPKDILNEGITEFTLLNNTNTPISERLLYYINEKKSLKSTITSSQHSYEPKSLVNLEIDIDSYGEKEVEAELSLSVTNTALIPNEYHSTDIKTYLLLASELRGEIEQPGYYFYSNDPQRKKNLDLLMRTQGWRQYLIKDMSKKTDYHFKPENGINIKGRLVSSFDLKKPLVGNIFLTAKNTDAIVQDKVKTDENGNFIFTNLNFADTTSVFLKAEVRDAKKKKNLNYKILFDSADSPKVSVSKKSINNLENYYKGSKKAQSISDAFVFNNKTIQLEEVFVKAKKNKVEDRFERKRKSLPYKEPSHTVDFKELGRDFQNIDPLSILQGRVPSLLVRATINGGYNVFLRGASSLTGDNSALILLNGTPLNGSPDILASDIDFIDIIKGPRAAIYGSRAANGVIAIFTRDGTESSADKNQTKEDGSISFLHPGYDYPKRFYNTKYQKKIPKQSNSDYRTTLHWQPDITLTEDGKGRVSFYTSDYLGEYQIILEGLTSDGVPLRTTSSFEVRINE